MNKSKKLISALCAIALVSSLFSFIPIANAINFVTAYDENVLSNFETVDDFADNRIIVLLSETASKRKIEYSTTDFHEIKATKVENLTTGMYEYLVQNQKADSKADKERIEGFKHILCIELSTSDKENVLNAIKALEGREDILYVGPDYVIRATSSLNNPPENNPQYVNQWAVSHIQLDDAWSVVYNQGTSSKIKVGVLDTGIYANHADLDDVVNANLSRDYTGEGGELGENSNHGTQVAGIIGAENNNQGICGISWNVELISLKVLKTNNVGYSSSVYSAISYATENDIPILNLSFGWKSTELDEKYNWPLDSIIRSYPGLVVCSAGNDGTNNDSKPYYPSNCSPQNVIAVGASTATDGVKSDSNYGVISVDVFAPGVNIPTTYLNGYGSMSQTSAAAPFVSGIAALILSQHPSLSGAQLREIIMDSVDTFSAFSGKCVTGGRVNAYKAVTSDLAHKYTVSRYSLMKHKWSCACGDYYYENHNWNDAGTACSDCGFYPMGDV